MPNQSVNDDGGFRSTTLPAPTVTNVVTGAVYSLVNNPEPSKVTINSSTGKITWDGDVNVNGSITYPITIQVANPDGGKQTVSFNLEVVNNG